MRPAGFLVLSLLVLLAGAVWAAWTPIRRGEPWLVTFLKMGSKRALAEFMFRPYALVRQGRISPVFPREPAPVPGEPVTDALQGPGYGRRRLILREIANRAIGRTRFPFTYQDLGHPRLRMLRERFGLDGVVTDGGTDFERALCVADWIRGQFGYGTPTRPVPRDMDGLQVLERGREGERFLCGHSCLAFAHCAQALGIHLRALNIAADLNRAHVVMEVWDDSLLKWAIVDVDNNAHYRRGGLPLNALELHRAWLDDDWDSVEAIFGENLHTKQPDMHPHKKLPFYAFFAVKMRNNWLSVRYPPWHPLGSCVFADLEWVDERTPGRPDRAVRTSREEDLYWTLDQVEVRLCGVREEGSSLLLDLHLDHSVPGFQAFEITAGGKTFRTERANFLWPLRPGPNDLAVQPVNGLGRRGMGARLEVEVTS